MAAEHLLALCAFLAVSSATLLMALVVGKATEKPSTPCSDLVAPENDVTLDWASAQPGVSKPSDAAASTEEVEGDRPHLGLPVAIIVAVVLVGGLSQAVRHIIRRQFDRVVSKITSDRPRAIGVERCQPTVPNWPRILPFAPDGALGGRALAPGHRAAFRMR